MPPVEIQNEKGPTTRLKFIRNTAYNGADYGPDYETDTCEVDSRYAPQFVANGRAVEVGGKGGPKTGEAQTRDPEPENRDPELKKK
jgi:hypothetical protein